MPHARTNAFRRADCVAVDVDTLRDQIQRDTLLSINPSMSIDERAYIDYGAYITLGYLSLDDNNNDNHILRQGEILGYTRMVFDGAHELFLRGRWGYRDFNDLDSFDGRGDEPIDGDLDVGYYRFDLARSEAAYHGRQLDYNVVIKAGRDLTYWANGLVLSERLDGVVRSTNCRTGAGKAAGVPLSRVRAKPVAAREGRIALVVGLAGNPAAGDCRS